MRKNDKPSILLFLIFCLLSAALPAQKATYKVLGLKDCVVRTADGEQLEEGKEFATTATLIFGPCKSCMRVMDDRNAGFSLCPNRSSSGYEAKPLPFPPGPEMIPPDIWLKKYLPDLEKKVLQGRGPAYRSQ